MRGSPHILDELRYDVHRHAGSGRQAGCLTAPDGGQPLNTEPHDLRVLLLNGPNLNLLGRRQPGIYGTMTLDEITDRARAAAARLGCELRHVQSNAESALIDAIHDAHDWAHGIVINPGAYGHYSYAIADAVSAVALPVIAVHLSNIYAREPHRQKDVIAPVSLGAICGLGWRGYVAATECLIGFLRDSRQPPSP